MSVFVSPREVRWIEWLWRVVLDNFQRVVGEGCSWNASLPLFLLHDWSKDFIHSLSHYLIISLSHYLTISLSHYLIISLSHYLIISLSHYLIISLSHYLIISLSHYLTISLSHYLTISLSHYLIISFVRAEMFFLSQKKPEWEFKITSTPWPLKAFVVSASPASKSQTSLPTTMALHTPHTSTINTPIYYD